MAAIFAFKCSSCGELHEGSPSFAFDSPRQYASLTDEQKATLGRLSEDLCVIEHDQGTDRFIRTVLEIPIHGQSEPFIWGVWVSLSEPSFRRYVETFDSPVEGDGFFGWLCNQIPGYGDHGPIATDVIVQTGRSRPKLRLHHESLTDEQLVLDHHHGITVKRAQQLAELAMHPSVAAHRKR